MQRAVHLVRFNPADERTWRFVVMFGAPDFYHRHWDQRAMAEIMEGDIVIFGKGDETQAVNPYTYDDSGDGR